MAPPERWTKANKSLENGDIGPRDSSLTLTATTITTSTTTMAPPPPRGASPSPSPAAGGSTPDCQMSAAASPQPPTPSTLKSGSPMTQDSPTVISSSSSCSTTSTNHSSSSSSTDRIMTLTSNTDHAANPTTTSAKPTMTTPPLRRRGAGWGIPAGLGLKGGADTISNGTSGWGPPPAASGAGGNAGGWGAAPPPNASASAAWGNPNPSDDANAGVNGAAGAANNPAAAAAVIGNNSAAVKAPQQQQGQNQQPNSSSSSTTGPQSSSSTPANPAGQASGSSQPPQGAASWAAAAGKGLPPASESGNGNGNSSSTNKQLEHLNSVREALFSQDGWGGDNVKQDTAWDSGDASNSQASASKDPPIWGGPPRNDGTDLWKSTLSGQPPAPKPQPSNPWGHTPQNPTDFKQWGEDDESGAEPTNTWRPDHPPGPYNNKPHDGWKNNMSSNTWNNDGPMGGGGGGMGGGGRNDMMPPPHDVGGGGNGWGAPPMPRQPNPGAGGQWGGPPGGRWDHESPTPGRRPYGHGGGPMDDASGTSLWGKGTSKWQDMPSMGRGGPPGPSGPRGMMVGGPDKPWGHGGPGMHGPRGGGGGGWGDEPISKGGWGDDPMKRDPGGWGAPGGPGGDGQWNKPPRGMMQGGIRSSPSWDEPGGGMDGGWNGGSSKQMEMAKQKELIWSSKSFKILCDMGYRKDDVEHALRVCNMRMEDAMEMLNQNGGAPGGRRMQQNQHDMGFGGDNPMDGRPGSHFPGYQDPTSQPGMPGGLGLNPPMGSRMGNGPGMMHPPRQQQQPQQQPPQQQQQGQQQPAQPSAQQLRLLVQQIQMAVQAGHLNPQILNQPLAPQTLLLLNQLLQQIKSLQQLQQQHQLTARGVNNPNSPVLMSVTVSITKTKQHIQNLQNQISAQQANYLKTQLPTAAAANPSSGSPGLVQPPQLGGNAPDSGTSTVQEMFNGISLMGSDAPAGNGSRLNQWKLPNKGSEFAKAPGGGAANKQQLPFDSGPWSQKNTAEGNSNGGWPETKPNAGGNSGGAGGNAGSDAAAGVGGSGGDFGIPEFEPGKPWKGPGLKNPDEDPNLTPGSVAAALSVGTLTKAVSSTSLATSGAEVATLGLTSPTWSLGGNKPDAPNAANVGQKGPNDGQSWPSSNKPAVTSSGLTSQIGQDLWGAGAKAPASSAGPNRQGPPGLTQSVSTSQSGWPSTSSANGWSTNSGAPNEGGSGWLILKNLTPQIDGSTLKTLCMQHGPLQHFDLYLNHSIALVMYASGREAAKAQKALNNCLLGNTTIHANMTSENEVHAILQQLGVSSNTTSAGNSSPTRGGTPSSSLLPKSSASETGGWGDSTVTTSAASGGGNSALFAGGSVWGAPDSSNNLHPFLPGDLLGENNM